MRVRVSQKNLRVEIENETRVLPESLSFENEMRVSQKSAGSGIHHRLESAVVYIIGTTCKARQTKFHKTYSFMSLICGWLNSSFHDLEQN